MISNNQSVTKQAVDAYIAAVPDSITSKLGQKVIRPVTALVELVAIPFAVLETIARLAFAILASPLLLSYCFKFNLDLGAEQAEQAESKVKASALAAFTLDEETQADASDKRSVAGALTDSGSEGVRVTVEAGIKVEEPSKAAKIFNFYTGNCKKLADAVKTICSMIYHIPVDFYSGTPQQDVDSRAVKFSATLRSLASSVKSSRA